MQQNENVTLTNDSSTNMKRWLHSLGYINDPYLQKMFKPVKPSQPIPAVEILQGYWARTVAVEHMAKKFLKTHKNCQIISLGAGFDTLYFRLKSFLEKDRDNLTESYQSNLSKYIEIDLPSVIRRKIGVLKRAKLEFNESEYKMVATDLCYRESYLKIFKEHVTTGSMPTLIIAECLFMYIPSDKVSILLNDLKESVYQNIETFNQQDLNLKLTNSPPFAIINYDAVDKNDQFSRNMKDNLRSNQEIDLYLNSVDNYRDLLKVKVNFGENVKFYSMNEIFKGADAFFRNDHNSVSKSNDYRSGTLPLSDEKNAKIPRIDNSDKSEVQRICRILPLDDVEIFNQIMEHYYFIVAGNFEFDIC